MKKVILLCGMLLALAASVASAAQGVNLRWNACLGDGGAINRNFACNSNSGTNALTGSFELGADLLSTSGNEIVVDIATASPSLPAWWAFRNVGSCRQASLTMNTTISIAAVNCVDWADGGATGGIGAYALGLGGANTARIVAAAAVPPTGLRDLSAGQEYFSYNLLINNAKTVGATGCEGCAVAACIVFNSLKLTTPVAVNDRTITGPTNGTDSNFATWQGGVGVNSGRGTGCPAATPTRNSTWGQVKSLYR